MGRKPVHLSNGHDTRQAVWEAIQALGVFTVPQVRSYTTLKPDTVRDYVTGLVAAGYVEELPRSGRTRRFKLLRDVGHDAPRVRRDGTPVTQGQGRENMWQAMHILSTFSARSLAIHARTATCMVRESTAADYIKHLHRAGYLVQVNAKGGQYRMLPSAYTGPKPPMVQRGKRVWDQNQNQLRWSSTGENHDQ